MKTGIILILSILVSNMFAQTQFKSPYKNPSWALDGGLLLGAFGLKLIDSNTEKNVKTLTVEDVVKNITQRTRPINSKKQEHFYFAVFFNNVLTIL